MTTTTIQTTKRNSTGYKIDRVNEIIILTKEFAKKADIYNSKEYKILKGLQRDTKFDVGQRTVSPEKDNHAGLSIQYMKQAISEHADKDTIMPEFERQQRIFKGHPAFYFNMKSWYLKTFPEETSAVKKAENIRANAIKEKIANGIQTKEISEAEWTRHLESTDKVVAYPKSKEKASNA